MALSVDNKTPNTASNGKTLYVEVADSLERSILKYNGTSVRLPTEYELADQFDVSRTVIREAMKILYERGLVRSKVGEGAYTARPNQEYMEKVLLRLIKSNGISDKDVTDVRIVLECAATRLACSFVDDAFISKLEECLSLMVENRDDIQKRVKYDLLFHEIIAKQSGNALLELFHHSILDVLRDYITRRIESRPAGNMDGINWHRRLISGFRKETPEEVEKMMRQHLMDSYNQI